MEDAVVQPSVFVVDGQTSVPFRSLEPKAKKSPCSGLRVGLGVLQLVLVAGLAVQGWFLLQLYWRVGQVAVPLSEEHAGSSFGKLIDEQDLVQNHPAAQEKPMAHLTGSNFSQTDSGAPLLWEAQLGMVLLKGFQYRDGALVVPKSGFYYIYSRVQLASLGCPDGGVSVSLGLYMRTPRYPEELELLMGRQTPCGQRSDSQIWWHSSSLGGLVQLEAGDQLVVRMRDARRVRVRDASRSYFGAFMV